MSHIDDLLYFEEGYTQWVIYDSLGYPTIGIGKKLGPKYTPLDVYNFNVPLDVAKAWVTADCKGLVYNLQNDARTKEAWNHCNEARQDVLIAMSYQLGFEGVCGFHNMLSAIEADDFQRAHDEMIDSVWHGQTENRCEREADVMELGTYKPYEGLIKLSS